MTELARGEHSSPAASLAQRWLTHLVACASGLAILLLALALSGDDWLWPHLSHFCLLAWDAVRAHWLYLLQLTLFVLLWLGCGVALFEWGRVATRTWRTVQRLHTHTLAPTERLQQLARRLGMESQIDLAVTEQPLAFCYGFWRPRVLISTGLLDLLDDEELTAVLAHERSHLRSRDPLKLLLGRALARGLFFFPLARDLVRGYELAREVAADAETVQTMGERAPLARALLKLWQAPSQRLVTALAVGGFNHVSERVTHLVAPQTKVRLQSSRARLVGSGLFAVLFIVVLLANLSGHPIAPLAHPNCPDEMAHSDVAAISSLGELGKPIS